MVAVFKHFPLVLDKFYKINPNLVDVFFLEISCIGEYYSLFRGQKMSRFYFFIWEKKITGGSLFEERGRGIYRINRRFTFLFLFLF